MATRKKKKPVDDDVDIKPDGYVGDLNFEEYWELNAALSNHKLSEANLLVAHLQKKNKILSYENEILKEKLNEAQIESFKSKMVDAKRELDETRKKISDRLGVAIEGCIINEALQVLKSSPAHGGD